MRHTAIDTAYDRNELQAMFAMAGIVRPVSKQSVSKQSVSKQFGRKAAGWFKPLLPITAPLAIWWQRKRQGVGSSAPALVVKTPHQNPQGAASPPMSHRPAGRRVSTVSGQQTLFVVLDQMGARHRAAASGDPLTRAFEQMLPRDHIRDQILAEKG